MGFFAARRMRAQGRHIHASERQDKGLRIGGRKSLSQKKAPPIWRGKTDSLEISQRGKTRIYAKFTARSKPKMNKGGRYLNEICATMSQVGAEAKTMGPFTVMLHNFGVLLLPLCHAPAQPGRPLRRLPGQQARQLTMRTTTATNRIWPRPRDDLPNSRAAPALSLCAA
jgi:hypothetical protein